VLLYVAVWYRQPLMRPSRAASPECIRQGLPAPHCNTLRHTATHCNTLQHILQGYSFIKGYLHHNISTFLDGYCSTVQGLLDWFQVDLAILPIKKNRKYTNQSESKKQTLRYSPANVEAEPCLDSLFLSVFAVAVARLQKKG